MLWRRPLMDSTSSRPFGLSTFRNCHFFPKHCDAAMPVGQNQAMTLIVEVAGFSDRMVAHLCESLVDITEAFQEPRDRFKLSETLEVDQPERHNRGVSVTDAGTAKFEEYGDNGRQIFDAI